MKHDKRSRLKPTDIGYGSLCARILLWRHAKKKVRRIVKSITLPIRYYHKRDRRVGRLYKFPELGFTLLPRITRVGTAGRIFCMLLRNRSPLTGEREKKRGGECITCNRVLPHVHANRMFRQGRRGEPLMHNGCHRSGMIRCYKRLIWIVIVISPFPLPPPPTATAETIIPRQNRAAVIPLCRRLRSAREKSVPIASRRRGCLVKGEWL